MTEDILPEIKKWVQFDEGGNQVATSTSVDTPMGIGWHEVEEFSYGKHMILDNGIPRIMTDEENESWKAEMLISGAKSATRHLRDVKLLESDWTEAAPLSEELRNQWREYRQALRDLPENVVDYSVVWPTPPA